MGSTIHDESARDDRELELEAILVPHDGAPDELTLAPTNVGDDELVTHWLTAQEGAFVALDDWR